ncbi:MAG TPA: Fe-S cluster assembly scaffold protein NifU [Clostridia bacterium]|nr:Fe-S cluster assembly scaffold protein NifU [Clostridia bacterium]
MLYTDIVMDHFSNPRNVGEIKDADGVGEVGNIQCGDIMKIYIKVENDVITDCKFKTFGCGSAIASSSVTTEMVIGKTIEEALELTNKDVVQQLGGLPSVKVHCSVLAEDALKVAIYDYAEKTGKEYKGLEGFEPSQLSHEH